MTKILVFANSYPYKKSSHFVFLKNTVDQFVAFGYDSLVIETQNLLKIIFGREYRRPYRRLIHVNGTKTYQVIAPLIFQFPNFKLLKRLNLFLLTRTIDGILNNMKFDFQIMFAHHLVNAGYLSYYFSKRYDIPYVLSLGESSFERFNDNFSNVQLNEIFTYSDGVIAASSHMIDLLKSKVYLSSSKKILIAPNAINPSIFRVMKKSEITTSLKVKSEEFIVIYVGSFTERKGINRLSEALEKINNPLIKAVFVGDGPIKPRYKNIIFEGKLIQTEIASYLNMADVFVLPSLNEGSCNAIVEAMACGLPIISSDRPFNQDILKPEYSILIDPDDTHQIAMSIEYLFENSALCTSMGKQSQEASKNYLLSNRVTNILNFMFD